MSKFTKQSFRWSSSPYCCTKPLVIREALKLIISVEQFMARGRFSPTRSLGLLANYDLDNVKENVDPDMDLDV